jgi:hypothetical protein
VKLAATRLSRARRLIFVFVGFIVVLGIIGAIVGSSAPPAEQPRCTDDNPCGEPPSQARPLQVATQWKSTATGVALEYDGGRWGVDTDEAGVLQLTSKVAGLILVVQTERSNDNANALLKSRRDDLSKRVLGLELDSAKSSNILGPAVGHVDGAGKAYVGAIDSPQGVQQDLKFAILSSTQKGVGIKVTVLTDEADPARRQQVYQLADTVLNTVTWP